MNRNDILICVFSYNMGVTLDNCLVYLQRFCKGFDVVLMDDASSDPKTLAVIEKWRPFFKQVFVNTTPKEGKRHGNLYLNIANAGEYALANGYRYLMMIQDDMQFVRPLTDEILAQYQRIFDDNDKVLQVDPRFLRQGKFEIVKELRAYRYSPATSYADVGITDLVRFKQSGWTLQEGERANKLGFVELGYQRYFPFTPVVMHVPFPQRYRKGKRRKSLFLLNRGKYGYHPMTEEEIAKMDRRDITSFPLFRTFLRVRNMHLSRILYYLHQDMSIFT